MADGLLWGVCNQINLSLLCFRSPHEPIPVVERVFDELKGHVHKDSLSQVLLLFVALVKDNLRQVRVFPHQHPHRRVKDLMNHISSMKPQYQNYKYVHTRMTLWKQEFPNVTVQIHICICHIFPIVENTWVPRRPGMALLLRIASFHWLLIMIVWIACMQQLDSFLNGIFGFFVSVFASLNWRLYYCSLVLECWYFSNTFCFPFSIAISNGFLRAWQIYDKYMTNTVFKVWKPHNTYPCNPFLSHQSHCLSRTVWYHHGPPCGIFCTKKLYYVTSRFL